MILAAHQLHYLPWLRYFHKLASADTFVILDNIQFNKNGWQNRNKIKTVRGELLLTVPVLHRAKQLQSEVSIDKRQPWGRKHWGGLQSNYQKSPFFKEHAPFFKQIYEREWEHLNDLNMTVLAYFIKSLGIRTRLLRSSELPLKGEGTERLINLCRELGARAYLTGTYATQVYLETAPFEQAGIELVPQEFKCPVYPQLYPQAGFLPELSIVDLLFNCGPRSLDILLQNSSAAPREAHR